MAKLMEYNERPMVACISVVSSSRSIEGNPMLNAVVAMAVTDNQSDIEVEGECEEKRTAEKGCGTRNGSDDPFLFLGEIERVSWIVIIKLDLYQ